LPAPQLGRLFGELGSGERDDAEGVVPRPVQEVLEEVDQARVGPLHVLEDEDRRAAVGETLEQDAPRGEQVLLISGDTLFEPEQMRQARLDVAAFVGIGNVLVDRRPELLEGGGLGLVFDDPAAHANHLGQCPVRDSFPVREAAGAMPPHTLHQAVHVLLELPRQTRLADAGDTEDGDEVSFLSSADAWRSSLISRNSRSRPTNGASRPLAFSAPARPAVTRSAWNNGIASVLPLSS
jgi:hypothetical protein